MYRRRYSNEREPNNNKENMLNNFTVQDLLKGKILNLLQLLCY